MKRNRETKRQRDREREREREIPVFLWPEGLCFRVSYQNLLLCSSYSTQCTVQLDNAVSRVADSVGCYLHLDPNFEKKPYPTSERKNPDPTFENPGS